MERKIEEHIKNLEEYCEVDDLFEKDGDFKEFCDGHIADIKAVLEELKNTQSDLYEANNCISDLLDVAKQRERIIDEILKTWKQDDIRSIEELRKYFEERCNDAKD